MKKTIMKEATKQQVLIGTSFELLPVCNLNCRMCYIRMDMEQVRQNGGLKTYEEWIELAKELREAGVLFLLLTGGEVFLYPHFRELYEALYDMGFVITINTNGTLINEEIVQWLKQRLPKCVSISLYGASDETYEKTLPTLIQPSVSFENGRKWTQISDSFENGRIFAQ